MPRRENEWATAHKVLHAILDTLFPTLCIGCGEVLVEGEQQLCLHCWASMQQAGSPSLQNNSTARTLLGLIPFEEALSLYQYHPQNTVQKVVHDMKFHHNATLCVLMGEQLGRALLQSGRFDDIDCMVPVPLHPLRKLQRGYNQSLLLCHGIAHILPRPIDTKVLKRKRYTHKQSKQGKQTRQSNVEGAFGVRNPERLAGHHILLVDDVVTSGATLASCYDALRSIPNLRISIATLSIATH